MQRLSIARAMMHDPQVLFLDEPRRGAGSADADSLVGNHSRIPSGWEDRAVDDAQYGRG